jgi:hypothetical protein
MVQRKKEEKMNIPLWFALICNTASLAILLYMIAIHIKNESNDRRKKG